MKLWKTLKSTPITKNHWVTISKERYQTATGRIVDDYYIVSKKDYAVIVAVDKGKIIFLEQYRPGLRQNVLNLPMGFIEPGETPVKAAKRELKEETGYIANNIRYIGKYALAPSFCTFCAHIFFSDDLEKIVQENPDDAEDDAKVVKVLIKNIPQLIRKGKLIDMSSALALSLTEPYMNNQSMR